MSGWIGAYTQQGLALLSKMAQGGTLNITRAVTGKGSVAEDKLSGQVAIRGQAIQTLSFKTPTYPESGTCKVTMFLTNKGLTTGYTVTQIGVYAYDPDLGEILFFIAQSTTGTIVSSESDMPGYAATWAFYFKYGQADGVTVTIDEAHSITEEMLQEVQEIAERGVTETKSGETVVIENTAELPFMGLKLYGKCTQEGIPTLETPIDLHGCVGSDVATVTVTGKNLLAMGSVTVTNHQYFALPKAFPVGEYTFSAEITSNDTDSQYSTVVFMNGGDNVAYIPLKRGKTTYTFTARQPIEGVDFCAGYNYSQGENDTATWKNIQLEYGATATEYTPSETAQYATIDTTSYSTNGVPVPSGGNYIDSNGQSWVSDEFDTISGTHTKRVNRVRITHTNPKTFIGSDGLVYYPLPLAGAFGTPVLCSHFPNSQLSFNSSGASLKFNFDNVEEFNTFMQNNTVDVVYILNLPIVTELAQTTIDAFNSLTAYNPPTTIFNRWGLGITVDCIRDVHEPAFKTIIDRIMAVNNKVDNHHKRVTVDADWAQTTGNYIITLADNTEYYIADTVQTLTLNYPNAEHFESYVKFTPNGMTDCIVFPTGTKYIGTIPEINNSCEYEIRIKDKVASINKLFTMSDTSLDSDGST